MREFAILCKWGLMQTTSEPQGKQRFPSVFESPENPCVGGSSPPLTTLLFINENIGWNAISVSGQSARATPCSTARTEKRAEGVRFVARPRSEMPSLRPHMSGQAIVRLWLKSFTHSKRSGQGSKRCNRFRPDHFSCRSYTAIIQRIQRRI